MLNVLRNLDWSVITDVLYSIIPALICITLHELSHGYVAYKLGDNTAKYMGRLTLNPIRHIDIMGLLSMVIFKFGWAKPVPVDMRNFKNPKRGMAITAAAGPISNVLISCIALFIWGLLYVPLQSGSVGQAISQMLYTTAYLSIALAVFNVIPIPPLDGSKVLFAVISDKMYYKLMRYERYGMILLLLLLVTGILSGPLGTATAFLFKKLFYIAIWASELVSKFM